MYVFSWCFHIFPSSELQKGDEKLSHLTFRPEAQVDAVESLEAHVVRSPVKRLFGWDQLVGFWRQKTQRVDIIRISNQYQYLKFQINQYQRAAWTQLLISKNWLISQLWLQHKELVKMENLPRPAMQQPREMKITCDSNVIKACAQRLILIGLSFHSEIGLNFGLPKFWPENVGPKKIGPNMFQNVDRLLRHLVEVLRWWPPHRPRCPWHCRRPETAGSGKVLSRNRGGEGGEGWSKFVLGKSHQLHPTYSTFWYILIENP